MVRRLRFRSWDGEKMTYYPDGSVPERKSGIIIMQSTGVAVDSKGRHWSLSDTDDLQTSFGEEYRPVTELYEGDIVHITEHWNEGLGVIIWWRSQVCWILYREDRITYRSHQTLGVFEKVVGNRYENPDLLPWLKDNDDGNSTR